MADAFIHDQLETEGPKTPEDVARYDELKRKVAAWDDPELEADIQAARAVHGFDI
jgi:GrpB-like predicted nucleotidyltransferase (UPF0157 family)